jgi:hypothetical protein
LRADQPSNRGRSQQLSYSPNCVTVQPCNRANAQVNFAHEGGVGARKQRAERQTRKSTQPAIDPFIRKFRFHPECPFDGLRQPCLLALYRDVTTDAEAGIHRIALTTDVFAGGKTQRRTLGLWPQPRAIKLWPIGPQLFLGEGIETVLAAATRLQYRGAPMRPAWAAGCSARQGVRRRAAPETCLSGPSRVSRSRRRGRRHNHPARNTRAQSAGSAVMSMPRTSFK